MPRDRQLARFIEERCPELDDVLVTAIDDEMQRLAPDGRGGGDAAPRRIQSLDRERIIGGFGVFAKRR